MKLAVTKLFPALCFILLLGLYVYSTAKQPTGIGDSNEIIVSGYLLSAAHPPGYPLSVISTHVMQRLLPKVSPANAANVGAALFQLLTLIFLYATLYKILTHEFKTSSLTTRLGAVLFTGLSALFWRYAAVVEVMAVGNFLSALLLYFSVQWYYSSTIWFNRYAFATAFIFGAGVGHLQTIITYAPALLFLLLAKLLPKKPSTGDLFKLGLSLGIFVVIGFTAVTTLIIPLNNRQMDVSWHFPSTADGWWRMVSRSDYKGFFVEKDTQIDSAYFSAASLLNIITLFPRYVVSLWNYYLGLPLIAGVVGFFFSLRSKRPMLLYVSILFLFSGIGFGSYVTMPAPKDYSSEYRLYQATAERQYLIGFLPLTLLIGVGLHVISTYTRRFSYTYSASILIIVICLGIGNASFGIMRHADEMYQIVTSLLQATEANAVVIADSDIFLHSLLYASYADNVRPDVTILSAIPTNRKYFIEKHPEFMGYNYPSNPLYYAQQITWNALKRPTYVTELNKFYYTYVGYDGDPLFMAPKGIFFKVSTQKPDMVEPFNFKMPRVFFDRSTDVRDFYSLGENDFLADHLLSASLTYAKYGKFDDAHSAFDMLVSLKDIYPEPYIQYRAGYQEFFQKFGYSKFKPKSFTERYAESKAAYESGNYAKAYDLARKALYMQPENKDILLLLHQIYIKGGYNDYAIEIEKHLQSLNN